MNAWNGSGNRRLSGGSYYLSVMQHPGAEHAREVARRAREHPGEWIDLSTGGKHGPASSKAHSIRSARPPMAFRPAGAYEARSETRADGYAVLVRFVGWPGNPP